MSRRFVSIVTVAGALLVAGCTTSGRSAPGADEAAGARAPAPAPPRPLEPTEGRKALERAVALFEQGRFAESMRLIQESPEILADGPQVRLQALKTLAFAQCVTGRRPACRRSVDAVLVLDPTFELAPAEAGHPSWGPEFERARTAARAGAAMPAGAAAPAKR